MKIYKILGKRGRITIPYVIRQELGLEQDDVISFEPQEDGSIIVRAEPRCCGCREEERLDVISLQEILDELPAENKREVLVYLSMQLALERRNNGDVR
jgi:bifunctional DNA-binding transcriptional regulator/antitoxin component of YhaV-PrlF toxin-antitoxin module